jgi:hypothetical protein
MISSSEENYSIYSTPSPGAFPNAEVLYPPCHEATSTYGTPGPTPPPFSEDTKNKALARAGNQCECTKWSGCH